MDSSLRRKRDTPTPDRTVAFPNNPASMADDMEIDEYDASPTARNRTPFPQEMDEGDITVDERKQLNPPPPPYGGDKANSDEERDAHSPMERKCITSYRPRHFSEGEGTDDYAIRKRGSLYKSFSLEKESTDIYGFVQLDVLTGEYDIGEKEWREIARWIKYEEDLEEGSDRLGKPHIAPLSFHYLVKLSHLIEKNSVLLLNLHESDISGITARIAETLLNKGFIQAHEVGPLMKDLLLQHRRVDETERGWFGSILGTSAPADGAFDGAYRKSLTTTNDVNAFNERRASMKPKRMLQMLSFSSRSLSFQNRAGSVTEETMNNTNPSSPRKSVAGSMSEESVKFLQQRRASIKQFPQGAETTMIMVRGEHKHKKGALVFVRLPEATVMNEVTQFPVATRFVIILLAPCGKIDDFVELGRSVGTLMSNRKYYDLASTATTSKDLVTGINNFLDETIVLPPGDWYNSNFYDLFPIHVLKDKSNLIKMRNLRHLQKIGLKPGGDSFVNKAILDVVPEMVQTEISTVPGPFVRTGKPFGGLINDIKRRYPLYKSDITMSFNLQCVAACIFLYFASIAHNITFGGIMNEKTKGAIGVTETLVAASTSGIIFALFSGQPLLCIAPTGPLLVFDEILFKFLESHEIEFLPARAWISIWVVVICLVVLFFEGSVFVRLLTRFTQETFALLISVIFVYESFHNLANTYKDHPLIPEKRDADNFTTNGPFHSDETHFENDVMIKKLVPAMRKDEPNTALLCTFLMIGTFYIAISLKHFRTSVLFGNKIRNFCSDFAVPISIAIMVLCDMWAGDVYTVKIKVPPGLQPTSPDKRGWFISPFGIEKPFNPWVPLITMLPGVLVFILVYFTVEICELIILKKPKVEKGCGFHLDALILSVTNLMPGFFGTPWLSCATLKALAHLSALTVYSKNDPPGQEPSIVMVLEQRVSACVMSIFLGLSILMAPALQHISMSVLFGVFLYMGISSLTGNQLFDRITLFFIPVEKHPQVEYVRRVPTWKIHLYTIIQIGLLAVLWGVKSIKQIALTFPFVLMMLVPIRLQLKRIFTENELDALDGDAKSPKTEEVVEVPTAEKV